jgi:hypothetical protein
VLGESATTAIRPARSPEWLGLWSPSPSRSRTGRRKHHRCAQRPRHRRRQVIEVRIQQPAAQQADRVIELSARRSPDLSSLEVRVRAVGTGAGGSRLVPLFPLSRSSFPLFFPYWQDRGRKVPANGGRPLSGHVRPWPDESPVLARHVRTFEPVVQNGRYWARTRLWASC